MFDIVVIAWYYFNHDDTTKYITASQGMKNNGRVSGTQESFPMTCRAVNDAQDTCVDTRGKFWPSGGTIMPLKAMKCLYLKRLNKVIGSNERRRKRHKNN